MYSKAFCKVYNEFGWNYFPEAFAQQLLLWLEENQICAKSCLDLGCGTGVLCEILHDNGILAQGMDFSEGMIEIARKSNPEIHYDVADMITYEPEHNMDLVTCTGDAINHIMDLNNVARIFDNVYGYLNPGGYLVFDLLNENEVSDYEPIELDFSETVKAFFCMTHDDQGNVNLQIRVLEAGVQTFEENIKETVHDPKKICSFLENSGFEVLQCAHKLRENQPAQATTWYVIARKPE